MSKIIINWAGGAVVFTERSYPNGYGFISNDEKDTRNRIATPEEEFDTTYTLTRHIDEALSLPDAEVVYHG